LVFDGNGWVRYKDAINVSSAREVGRILDELGLAVPPSAYAGNTNPKIALGTNGISVRLYKSNSQGKYRANDFSSGIILSPSVRDGKAGLLHEFGHFLDYEGLAPEDGWEIHVPFSASNDNPYMLEILRLASESADMDRLLRYAPENERSYWTDRSEVFARVFAQWAVLRSGGNMDEFLKSANFRRANGDEYNHQWLSAQDFAPIADALDALFTEAGWLQ